MTYEQRQATGRQLCQKLMERISEVATAVPLDYWPPIAGAPSAAFMVALTAWEIAPSDRAMRRVSETYESVIEAWRIAATEFSAEGAA